MSTEGLWRPALDRMRQDVVDKAFSYMMASAVPDPVYLVYKPATPSGTPGRMDWGSLGTAIGIHGLEKAQADGWSLAETHPLRPSMTKERMEAIVEHAARTLPIIGDAAAA